MEFLHVFFMFFLCFASFYLTILLVVDVGVDKLMFQLVRFQRWRFWLCGGKETPSTTERCITAVTFEYEYEGV